MSGDTIITRSGKSISISDEDKFIHHLLESLNGKKSIEATYTSLHKVYRQKYNLDIVIDIIKQLDNYRLFENMSRTMEQLNILSDYQRTRWSRNFEFFNAYCDTGTSKLDIQKRIVDAKITLLGLGGLGSHALFDLVSLGFTHIVAIDFDKVDLSNLNRQILYGEKDIGRNKTDAARDTIERYIGADHNNIQFHDVFLDSWQKIMPFVSGADVVMSCVDRPAAVMDWVNEACIRAQVPLVAGGLDTTRSCTFTILPGATGCVECWRRHERAGSARQQQLIDLGLAVDVMKLPPRAAPVHLAAVEVGLMVAEVLKIVTGIAAPAAVNKLVQYDFDTMTVGPAEEWTLDPTCPVCSSLQARDAAE